MIPESARGIRSEHLDKLLEVIRRLAAGLELEPLLQAVIDAALELTGSHSAAVWVYEQETDLLKFVAGSQSEKEALKRIRIPLQQSIIGEVYTDSKPLLINDARADPRLYRGADRLLGKDTAALIAVPLVFRGDCIGVIVVTHHDEPQHYTESDVSILETITSQASAAILANLMVEEMKQAYAVLEESERKKSDFIAIASHEFRTPLGLILGHAMLLLESCSDESARSQLEVIVQSAERLRKIVDDFTRISSTPLDSARGKSHRVAMVALIREVVSSFQQTARNSYISLSAELPRQENWVEGDEERLKIALTNLIENALIFTDRNGHVLVSAEKLPGYLKVSVIDDGIGIPAKDLPKVFDRFYQVGGHLTRRHGGMGLGLSVAKAMIEMHSGEIWVESIEGKGSNFSFVLPFLDAEAYPLQPVPTESRKVQPFS